MKPSEVLREARKLIEQPEAWTQREYSRGIDGIWKPVESGEAVCFCALGAIKGARKNDEEDDEFEELYELLSRACGGPVHVWNDRPEREHKDVLAVYDRAIAIAIAEEEES